MSNRYNKQFLTTPHNRAILLDCNFVVDSTNGNGLGIRSLKNGGRVQSVQMQDLSYPANSPNLASSSTYAVLAASAVTNTGNSVVTGNLGLYPGTSVTGFPPATVSGAENIANSLAQQAQADALAAYNNLNARSATSITANLDGQTLTPGVYTETSGTFNLATSGNATLTLNGAGLYVFICSSTLTTGAGGIPTIALTGGALASNVYWVVRTSATLNASASGAFQGTVLAHTSITVDGGSVAGRLFANTGAITFAAAVAATVPPLPLVAGSPAPGIIKVDLQDNYAQYRFGSAGWVSPVSGTALSISSSNVFSVGSPYIIVSLGSTTQAQWQAMGLPAKIKAAVGVSFLASATGSGTGSGQVMAPISSNIDHMEVFGDPNLMNSQTPNPNNGQEFIIGCFQDGVLTAPLDGTVIALLFYFNDSIANSNQF